ncbi:hypothetical protein E2562_021342 [Oryza meyeriana var. granulata]|uniref:Uncharacterized protein n=1 Tax=Oryza meyeriana var. granulata TaxID=110450 RepID=A0A6G1BYX4_9ORYZ|nr:hypothetical protein E2562_021342 [Oryza meyeriana var. granulata]
MSHNCCSSNVRRSHMHQNVAIRNVAVASDHAVPLKLTMGHICSVFLVIFFLLRDQDLRLLSGLLLDPFHHLLGLEVARHRNLVFFPVHLDFLDACVRADDQNLS